MPQWPFILVKDHPMGLNKAYGTSSVSAFCREVTYFTSFLLNFLCPKIMKITVNLKQYTS